MRLAESCICSAFSPLEKAIPEGESPRKRQRTANEEAREAKAHPCFIGTRMLSLSAAACAYSLNAPVVVPQHVAPRSGRPVLAMSRREMGQSAALAAAEVGGGAAAAQPLVVAT